jgi:hypothetical protein
MRPKYSGMFFEGDDGGGGGGGGESPGMAVFEGGGETAPRTEGATAPAEPRRESSPTVDARELATQFGNVIGQHFKPPQKEISVEEAKKLLNVWEPSTEWLARYDNLETRNQAIAEQRDGLIRQADTIMQYRMGEMQRAMEARYAPVVHFMQQQEAHAGEQRFAQTFPQLAHDGLRPLLFSVAQSMLAQGVKFNSERELFTAIARGVEAVIKVSNPGFSIESNGGGGGTAPQTGKKVGPTGGGIPVTSPGSGGGGGQKGAGPPKPRGMAIFDP